MSEREKYREIYGRPVEPADRAAFAPDSRPLLEEAGFRVLAYDRIPSWDRRAVATYRALLANRDLVAAVAGEALVREAEWGAQHSVHVLIVCERVD